MHCHCDHIEFRSKNIMHSVHHNILRCASNSVAETWGNVTPDAGNLIFCYLINIPNVDSEKARLVVCSNYQRLISEIANSYYLISQFDKRPRCSLSRASHESVVMLYPLWAASLREMGFYSKCPLSRDLGIWIHAYSCTVYFVFRISGPFLMRARVFCLSCLHNLSR